MSTESIILQTISTKVPHTLFHYTNSAGLLGILKDSKIWMTKIHYLNDTSELQLAFDYIRKEIDIQKSGASERRIQELEDMEGALDSIFTVNVSVASFTKNNDQLSQWRGYCEIGTGYSIGFDGEKLSKKVKTNKGYYIVPCVYDKPIHELMVKELVNSTSVFNKEQNLVYSNSPFFEMSFSQAVLFLAPMIKSEKFKDECEWRLISPLLNVNDASFRQGNHSLIPYWEFDVEIVKTLSSITIGPTPECELSKQALVNLIVKRMQPDNVFSNNILNNIECSRVPYRNL